MSQDKNTIIAKNIIMNNDYMSIATSYMDDTWIAPVYYVSDDKYNLYFVSSHSARHISDSKLNNNVAVSIFDTDQVEGSVNGLQIKGTLSQVSELMYKNIIKLYYNKNGIWNISDKMFEDKIQEYSNNERAIFQIRIDIAYIQDPGYFQKHKIDKRIEVNI